MTVNCCLPIDSKLLSGTVWAAFRRTSAACPKLRTQPLRRQFADTRLGLLCFRAGTFCVKNGAANQKYFESKYGPPKGSLKIEAVPSITNQIEWMATPGKGTVSCDAIELTTEDLLKWGKDKPDATKCKGKMQGAIVKRPRGMLAPLDKACIITGMNGTVREEAPQPAGGS